MKFRDPKRGINKSLNSSVISSNLGGASTNEWDLMDSEGERLRDWGVDGTELWIMKGSFGTVALPCSILKFHKDLKRLGNYDV